MQSEIYYTILYYTILYYSHTYLVGSGYNDLKLSQARITMATQLFEKLSYCLHVQVTKQPGENRTKV